MAQSPWELGIHSYLNSLRDRLLLARELLHESGSIFVQINDENLHRVRELLDDVFGSANMCAMIAVRKTAAVSSPMARTNVLPTTCDYLVWCAKDARCVKYRQLFLPKAVGEGSAGVYSRIEEPTGARRRMTSEELSNPAQLPKTSRVYRLDNLTSTGWSEGLSIPVEYEGKQYTLGPNLHWKTTPDGIRRLVHARRIAESGSSLAYVRFVDDFPVSPLTDIWLDTGTGSFTEAKVYAVQTNTKILQRCLLMTTDPGDLVFDPTCGSGTTAHVAEEWGRRWITCDTSRVSITLAKQRLMTAVFDYYKLAHPEAGIGSGFVYKTVPHVTLKSIANNPEIKDGMTRVEIDAAIAKHADKETLYDKPEPDKTKARVTGPFTVEAVPAINVRPIDEVIESRPYAVDAQPALGGIPDLEAQQKLSLKADVSVVRSGETLRQTEWRDELARTGVRGRGGQRIEFTRLESLPAMRHLHALGETKENRPTSVVVSFGPEHAPLEQRQVEQAWEEARTMSPRPAMIVFAAFHFDPEAAKDIDELTPDKTGMVFLKVQMNTDLLTEDLKKKRASNESFWLVGQPDVALRKIHRGGDAGKWEVEVLGFDYYNTRTGQIESGDTSKIAMWMLDTDYDGRSLYPRQVFLILSPLREGIERLAKTLKAEIDPELIESYTGAVSLPFDLGDHRRVAVKIVDDRGIESLKIVTVERT